MRGRLGLRRGEDGRSESNEKKRMSKGGRGEGGRGREKRRTWNVLVIAWGFYYTCSTLYMYMYTCSVRVHTYYTCTHFMHV